MLSNKLSKVLANRLKIGLRSKCISPQQSAFVDNMSILDNAMVSIEAIHHMKCKTSGKVGDVALIASLCFFPSGSLVASSGAHIDTSCRIWCVWVVFI